MRAPVGPARSLSVCLRLLGAVAGVSALTATVAHAQRSNGSIGVSLEILQPVSTQAVRVLGFSVDPSGMATLRTTSPVHGSASQVVMSSIASSAANFESVQQRPALVRGELRTGDESGLSNADSPQLSYRVNVGHVASAFADARPVQLRIRYLAVAGT